MTAPRCELRLGDWRDTMADETCDALICDPPYSARTHEGQRTGDSIRAPTIGYAALTEADALDIATSWSPRVRWWAAVFGDHASWAMHEAAWAAQGWMTFAPVIWLPDCPPPRMAGDGPACAAEYIMVARPRHRMPSERMGSRPGRYDVRSRRGCEPAAGIAGQKADGGMRALVRDYSLRGDTICDPFAGSGSTLLAARVEGRHSVGSELDPKHHAIAMRRLTAGWTPGLFAE